MKILHILPYLPTPPTFGGAIRIYHLLKHLDARHDVTVAGFCDNGDLDLFKQRFSHLQDRMHLISRKQSETKELAEMYPQLSPQGGWQNLSLSTVLQNKVNKLLEQDNYDIVLTEMSALSLLDLHTDALCINDVHNVEYDNFRRMSRSLESGSSRHFYQQEYKKAFIEEIRGFSKQDALFVTSRSDGELIREHVPDVPQFVIPNGVATNYFASNNHVDELEPYSMVFTGDMGYVPNLDAMIYFLDEIFPLIQQKIPQARIYIVGANPPEDLLEYASDAVQITGYVQDVRPYINRASVYVVPLRLGSGTRFKVPEALSMKMPVVSTRLGSEGIEVEDGEHLLLRDQPRKFAEAVYTLMTNRQLCRRLVEDGYELVANRYDWDVISEQVDQAFETLLEQAGKTATTKATEKTG